MPRVHPHPACLDDEALVRHVVFRAGRSGGPGGQHRNKVETHVVATHTPTGISAQAGERRSQVENKHVALKRLRLALAVAWRCCPPPQVRVHGKDVLAVLDAIDAPGGSDLWRSRVRAGRVACNTDHHDFPAMLAEALDHVAEAGWDERAAAARLGVTPSQLVKLVKQAPEALAAWNRARAERGLHALH